MTPLALCVSPSLWSALLTGEGGGSSPLRQTPHKAQYAPSHHQNCYKCRKKKTTSHFSSLRAGHFQDGVNGWVETCEWPPLQDQNHGRGHFPKERIRSWHNSWTCPLWSILSTLVFSTPMQVWFRYSVYHLIDVCVWVSVAGGEGRWGALEFVCNYPPDTRLTSGSEVLKGRICDKLMAVFFYYFSDRLTCYKLKLAMNFPRSTRKLCVFLGVH